MGWLARVLRDPAAPKPVTDDEIDDWFDAAASRDAKPPRASDRETLRNFLRGKNPVRWHRMQKDFAWACKEMRKLGMNPEDTRWLL